MEYPGKLYSVSVKSIRRGMTIYIPKDYHELVRYIVEEDPIKLVSNLYRVKIRNLDTGEIEYLDYRDDSSLDVYVDSLDSEWNRV